MINRIFYKLFHDVGRHASCPTLTFAEVVKFGVYGMAIYVTDAAWARGGARQANLALVLQNSADLRQLFQGPPMTYLQ